MDEFSFVIKRLEGFDDAQKAYCCMMEVPTPWPQALCQCRDWIADNLGRFVEGYHLESESGQVVGHLYFALSERALFPYEVESGVGVLYCDWVQKSFQGKGLGKQLFETYLSDMRQEGVKGIVVEATDMEGQMHFEHYQKRGFKIISQNDHRRLLYLPITQEQVHAQPITSLIRPRKGTPVDILILNGYMCPYDISTQVVLHDIAGEFGDHVVIKEAWLTPETLREYGTSSGIFINGHQKLAGAETEEAIRKAIIEEF